MSDDITGQSVVFPELFLKPLRVQFDERHGSSDGGAILLKACDAALNLSRRLAECLVDRRQAGKVEHSVRRPAAPEALRHRLRYEDGNDAARLACDPIHKLLLERLRVAFPRARSLVRLDGGFAASELFDFLENRRCDYVVAMAKNKRLAPRAARLMGTARRLSRRSGKTAHVYGQIYYAARRWKIKRRVIIKAEVVRHPGREPKMNPRFVVTNLKGPPRRLYEKVYCARGDIENRIKELHHGLQIDRTSCPRFLANQFRVLLTAAAYALMQELRRRAAGTTLARAQVSTLRERLLKLGARIECSARRILVHLSRTEAWQHEGRRIAISLGAVPA